MHNRLFTIAWGIGPELRGLSGAAVRRTAALAKAEGCRLDILTLDDATAVGAVEEQTAREVAGGHLVKIHNIWESIGEWSDRGIATLCSPVSDLDDVPKSLEYEGEPRRVLRDETGAVIRVDHFRQDGSRWCTDLRQANRDGDMPGRIIRTFDRNGLIAGRWHSPSRFYFSWIDKVIGPGNATVVTDSEFVGSFLHKFHRGDVRIIQVLHRLDRTDDRGDGAIKISSTQRKILNNVDRLTALAVTSPPHLDALRQVGVDGSKLAILPGLDGVDQSAEVLGLWRGVLSGRVGGEQVAAAREALMSDAERMRAVMSDPIDGKVIHWESTHGSGALCNPEAMFREAINDPTYADFQHVWTLSAEARQSLFGREFADHPRVRFVERKSPEYWKSIHTAKFLVNNTTFPFSFSKRPAQVYVNTWHGTPLKKMGYDVEDGARLEQNACRNFILADYLVAQNGYMADGMYLDAHRLQGLFGGAIIEEGTLGLTICFVEIPGIFSRKRWPRGALLSATKRSRSMCPRGAAPRVNALKSTLTCCTVPWSR